MQAFLSNLITLTGGMQGFLILVMLAALLVERRAEAAARSAEAAARSAEAGLCYINVRRWDGHTSALVKLRLSLAHFRVEALGAVRVAGQARLYTVRGDGWQERQPLTDASYAALLHRALNGSDMLVDVLVFQPLPGTDTSPDKAPVDGPQAPVDAPQAPSGGVARARGGDEASSGRSSAVQSEFRIAIVRRDGKACVLCRSSSLPLEAAPVIPRTAGLPLLHAAGLLTANQVNNGMLLCTPCHRLYDAFMWCFDPTSGNSGVVVAEALLCDAALGDAWRARVGTQLSQPDDTSWAINWPLPSAWTAALGLFHEAREKRHAYADAARFPCSVCGNRWGTARGLTRHTCSGAQASATYHTPFALRRRAGGGGGSALVEEDRDEDDE